MKTKPTEKAVIVGGVHGDDQLSVEVLTHFFKHRNPLFQLVLGNYKAVEQQKKYLDFDLLKAGKGDATCTTAFEKCRAAEIHEVLEQFSYVVDVHGSHSAGEYAIVTAEDHRTLAFAQSLGVSRIIVIEPANYLIESVPHAVTLVKRVQAKPAVTPDEVAETVLMLNRLEEFFAAEDLPEIAVDVLRLPSHTDNMIDFLIHHQPLNNT